jgi:hypothetical protein
MAWRDGPSVDTRQIPEDIDGIDLMSPRVQVLQRAARELSQLHKDASSAFIHQLIIRSAMLARDITQVKRLHVMVQVVQGTVRRT